MSDPLDKNCGWPECRCGYGCMGRAAGHPYDREKYAKMLEKARQVFEALEGERGKR